MERVAFEAHCHSRQLSARRWTVARHGSIWMDGSSSWVNRPHWRGSTHEAPLSLWLPWSVWSRWSDDRMAVHARAERAYGHGTLCVRSPTAAKKAPGPKRVSLPITARLLLVGARLRSRGVRSIYGQRRGLLVGIWWAPVCNGGAIHIAARLGVRAGVARPRREEIGSTRAVGEQSLRRRDPIIRPLGSGHAGGSEAGGRAIPQRSEDRDPSPHVHVHKIASGYPPRHDGHMVVCARLPVAK